MCTTSVMFEGGDMAGVPSADTISIASAMIPECFLLWGKLVYRRVYVLYGTKIPESNLLIS